MPPLSILDFATQLAKAIQLVFLLFLELINPEDQTLSFISTMNSDALLAVEVKHNEFLLCFAGTMHLQPRNSFFPCSYAVSSKFSAYEYNLPSLYAREA